MKKMILAALIALPLAFSARAQWIVYDPISATSSKSSDEAQNLAEYAQMIENEVHSDSNARTIS
jgi:peptidoglycan hydrolase CwlO-like protein